MNTQKTHTSLMTSRCLDSSISENKNNTKNSRPGKDRVCCFVVQRDSVFRYSPYCTQQYVSKILKGKENLSLETLSKLEDALGISLILDDELAYPNMVAEEPVPYGQKNS